MIIQDRFPCQKGTVQYSKADLSTDFIHVQFSFMMVRQYIRNAA